MKCFLIYNGFLNSKNGSNTHVVELAKNLSDTIDVTFFVRKSTNNMHTNLNVVNIPVLNMFPFTAISHQLMLLFYLFYYSIVKRPDIIYARQDGFSFSLPLIQIIFKKPYIVEINGLLDDEAKMLKSPGFTRKFKSRSEKINYKLADKIVAVTKGIKDGIVEQFNVDPQKIHVISNGANIDMFKPLDQNKCKLELDPSINYVCFVGNLAPWQGVEYLIQAAPLILSKCPNVNFLIVGDGIMKDKWMQLAEVIGVSDKFIFTGSVPYEKIPLYINASGICVAPFPKARNEKIGLSPLKLYEYMACGKPVVASNIKGVGNLLELEQTGIAVPPENPDDLATAIIKLLKNESIRKKMGINSRKCVVENHSWASVAEKVANVCKNTIADYNQNK